MITEKELFDCQLRLASITGSVLGLRKVVMDYQFTELIGKEVVEDLGKIADEITEVVNFLKNKD